MHNSRQFIHAKYEKEITGKVCIDLSRWAVKEGSKDKRWFSGLKRWFFTVLALIVAASIFSGCGNPYKSRFDSSPNNLGQRTEGRYNEGPRAYGYTRRGGHHHDNQWMEFSQVTATEIMRMPGVAAAYVVLTDKNAYVGAVLDDTATGTAAHGGIRDVDNSGTSEGVYDVRDGSPYADPRKIVTDRNSFNTFPEADDISPRLKQKIALKVREMNPDIEEVFISANRNFVNDLNEYAIEYRAGKSLEPYIQEFNRKVALYFPPPSQTENK